jgi:hypothetical protein
MYNRLPNKTAFEKKFQRLVLKLKQVGYNIFYCNAVNGKRGLIGISNAIDLNKLEKRVLKYNLGTVEVANMPSGVFISINL